MALALKPKLLLLDEPTGGMSPEERRVTGELLAPIKAHCALIIVEHDLDFIRDICDRLTVLDQGRVLDHGTVETIQRSPKVQEMYHQPCLTQPLLEVDGLCAGYGRSQVLFGVSLNGAAPRGAVAVLGRNGAGKTTLLKTWSASCRPMSGTIRFDGAAVEARCRPSGACGAASATCRRSMRSSPS